MRTHLKMAGTRKGSISIYMIFSFFLLIPMSGLAIDFAVMYSVKAKLQTAVDAAAIGSGNTLNRGAVMDTTAVRDVARRFFDANFPDGYFGSGLINYQCDPVQGNLGVRTVTVSASERVPMLLLRVLGLSNSTVAAVGQVTVRFVNMMMVVDRSGSVQRAKFNGIDTSAIVESSLRAFVDPSDGSNSPYFSDGRDNVGLLTYGTNWRLDYPMSLHFQTSTPDIGAQIDALDWNTNNSTNTADGLFHAYRELQKLNQPGALNVIVLLTDGRPSAFSGTFTLKATNSCSNKTAKVGVLTASVNQGWIPPTTGNTLGIFSSTFVGITPTGDSMNLALNSTGCAYAALDSKGVPISTGNVSTDIANFPSSVILPDDNPTSMSFFTTQSTNSDLTTFMGAGTATTSPRAIRYAAFNVADNVATRIRSDTNISPVIFVIGLNNNNGEEALDADWLARVANDKDYLDGSGHHVNIAGQTNGSYFNVNAGGIEDALREIASEILRFSR